MGKIILIAVLMLVNVSALASQEIMIPTGRYSTVTNLPSSEQMDPLRVIIKTKIPQSVKTVGEAISYLLVRSGYTLVKKESMSTDVKTLMELDLPQVHRKLGPITLDVALHALCGFAYELVVDPIHRKISFELTSNIERVIQ